MSEVRTGLPPEQEQEIRAEIEAERKSVSGCPKKESPAKPSIDFKQLKRDLDDNFIGDARRYVARNRGQFLYDNTEGVWYKFQGCRWVKDNPRQHLKEVAELAPDFVRQGIYHQKRAEDFKTTGASKNEIKREEALAKKYKGRAERLKDPTSMNKVLSLAGAGKGSLGIAGDEWNKYPTLFACKNCILDLETGKTLKPDPNLYINQASNVEWRGLHQEASLWEAFLNQIFLGDQDLIDYVQLCVGYWLTGLATIQEFWTLFGPMGRNGKGVFFRTIRAIMGNYYSSIPSGLLTESKMGPNNSGPSPEIVNLMYSRLAVASETAKRSRISEDALKTFTGGDPVICRALYSNVQHEFIPYFKILFAFNRFPQVDGADTAFRARLNVIPFKARFTNIEKEWDDTLHIYPLDPMLEKRLQQPDILSEILSWALRGSTQVFRLNLNIPKASVVQTETEDAMADMDPIGEFIEQCLEITAGDSPYSRTRAKPLYEAYVQWCEEEKKMSSRFIKTMTVFGGDFKNRSGIEVVPPMNVRNYNVRILSEKERKEKRDKNS